MENLGVFFILIGFCALIAQKVLSKKIKKDQTTYAENEEDSRDELMKLTSATFKYVAVLMIIFAIIMYFVFTNFTKLLELMHN